VGGGEGGA
jgi:hypothetical protein